MAVTLLENQEVLCQKEARHVVKIVNLSQGDPHERTEEQRKIINERQKKVDEILSGKNEIKAMHGDVCGEFVIAKTFKLAPLYSYYIHLYGMPAFGVGFDPKKLQLVKAILSKHGIA